jgi:hypothetical protein
MITFPFRKKLLAATVGSLFMALASAVPSMAATVTYTGTTAGQPTWHRPDVVADPPVILSPIANNVRYSSQVFNVSTSGLYNFLSTATSPANWNNVLFLYQNSFNSATPLVNALIGNDNFPNILSIGTSGFNNVSLTTGVNYFLVTTGFLNSNSGSFSNSITGPGNIALAPVPEPFTILGTATAAGLGVAMRRKQKQQQKATAKVG